MKKLSIIIFGICCLITSTSLGQDVETRNVDSFDEIRVAEAIDVYLKQGSKESVKVEAKGISADHVLTEVSGGRLKIHLDEGRHRNHSVKVWVTFVNLKEISASSASGVFSEGLIKGDELEISVSSAADVDLEVNFNKIEVSASSSGDVELKGKVKIIEISVSSAGDVDAYDVDAEVGRVRASSAGSAKVSVSKEIDARASSGGSIRYRGNPSKSQTDSSSGGSVRKSN